MYRNYFELPQSKVMQRKGRIFCLHETLESTLLEKYPISRDLPAFPFCHVSYCQISPGL